MRPGILAGLKVLVVDDEPDNRQFLIVAIEQLGATAMAVASAPEAIDILQQSPPDILVSDIGMPVEDGYSLIRKVRSSESDKIKRLPAVALTAYASEEDRDRAIATGYNEQLTKPRTRCIRHRFSQVNKFALGRSGITANFDIISGQLPLIKNVCSED